MDKAQFLLELEEVLELDARSLQGGEVLNDIPQWGSLAVLGVLAMADEKYGCNPAPKAIQACKTVNDLFLLVDSLIS